MFALQKVDWHKSESIMCGTKGNKSTNDIPAVQMWELQRFIHGNEEKKYMFCIWQSKLQYFLDLPEREKHPDFDPSSINYPIMFLVVFQEIK